MPRQRNLSTEEIMRALEFKGKSYSIHPSALLYQDAQVFLKFIRTHGNEFFTIAMEDPEGLTSMRLKVQDWEILKLKIDSLIQEQSGLDEKF